MLSDEEVKRLMEEHEMAYFRGDLATSMPESYSIDEMREISEAMDASTAKVDAAMRADFEAMPPEMKVKMLDMLVASGMESREWWEKILCGFEVPDAPLGE
jgi:actin-like ATPase involved in cell morphogenesis